MREIPFLVPSITEQAAIAEYLDKETTNIDTALNNTRREIELLQEYRTVLIADVVSGKVDVREVAANLPDDADDAEIRAERDPYQSITRRFKVSSLVAARRTLDLNLIDRDAFFRFYQEYKDTEWQSKTDGGNF